MGLDSTFYDGVGAGPLLDVILETIQVIIYILALNTANVGAVNDLFDMSKELGDDVCAATAKIVELTASVGDTGEAEYVFRNQATHTKDP